jgi:hypothetical protein
MFGWTDPKMPAQKKLSCFDGKRGYLVRSEGGRIHASHRAFLTYPSISPMDTIEINRLSRYSGAPYFSDFNNALIVYLRRDELVSLAVRNGLSRGGA